MPKKIIHILSLIFFTISCQTLDSVKRGMTGEKKSTADEFLIKKKDPLILPPDFENLPTPDERNTAIEEISNFEKTLGTSIEETSSSQSSVEELILRKIQQK